MRQHGGAARGGTRAGQRKTALWEPFQAGLRRSDHRHRKQSGGRQRRVGRHGAMGSRLLAPRASAATGWQCRRTHDNGSVPSVPELDTRNRLGW